MRTSCCVKFKFDSAHRLLNYQGKCKHLHGHTYKLAVYIEGDVDKNGMILDFTIIKTIIKSWIDQNLDHAIIISKSDYIPFVGSAFEDETIKYYEIDGETTAENIAIHLFSQVFQKLLPTNVKLKRIELWETDDCSIIVEV